MTSKRVPVTAAPANVGSPSAAGTSSGPLAPATGLGCPDCGETEDLVSVESPLQWYEVQFDAEGNPSFGALVKEFEGENHGYLCLSCEAEFSIAA